MDNPLDIDTEVLYVELVNYYEQLSRYYEYYDEKNINVVINEDLSNNGVKCLRTISKFLNIKEYCPINLKKININRQPKNLLIHTIAHKLRAKSPEFLNESIKGALLRWNTIHGKREKLNHDTRKLIWDIIKFDFKKLSELIKRDLTMWVP